MKEAQELLRMARFVLAAETTVVAIFPGENPRNPFMFYYMDSGGRVWYTMSPHSRGVVMADTYQEFIRKVMDRKVKALWVENGEVVNHAPWL